MKTARSWQGVGRYTGLATKGSQNRDSVSRTNLRNRPHLVLSFLAAGLVQLV